MKMWLPQPLVMEVFQRLNALRDFDVEKALDRIDPAFVSSLQDPGRKDLRIFGAIGEMNRVERLLNGTCPLELFLEASLELTTAHPEVQQVLRKALAQIRA